MPRSGEDTGGNWDWVWSPSQLRNPREATTRRISGTRIKPMAAQGSVGRHLLHLPSRTRPLSRLNRIELDSGGNRMQSLSHRTIHEILSRGSATAIRGTGPTRSGSRRLQPVPQPAKSQSAQLIPSHQARLKRKPESGFKPQTVSHGLIAESRSAGRTHPVHGNSLPASLSAQGLNRLF